MYYINRLYDDIENDQKVSKSYLFQLRNIIYVILIVSIFFYFRTWSIKKCGLFEYAFTEWYSRRIKITAV